jgi:ornithine--oxo-acid transaminase
MTPTAAPPAPIERVATRRHLLMCPPRHFEVSYAINPWMDVDVPVDQDRALAQWSRLREVYEELGHRVEVMEPAPGLPDMVFTANAGVVHDGRVLVSRFTHPARQPESAEFLRWFAEAGFAPAAIAATANEGEGDVLTTSRFLLAADGPRTSLAAHHEMSAYFDVPVVPLELVDPRFYHLDTALTVLDEHTVAYYPGAFSAASVARIEGLFPGGTIRASEEDACGFGLNAMSDGRNVVMSDRAPGLRAQLEEHGFHVVGVDMSELIKAGGSAKCCTLELRP